ncbi:MAG: LD-carboxypeptidase [Kofleriaceae bacterium]
MSAVIPQRMKRGDKLGVIAPAGPIRDITRLHSGLAVIKNDFDVVIAPSLLAPRGDVPSYLSASDETRAAELNAMIRNPDIRGILLARGGYGLMRILPMLDAAALRNDPKPICGFSDATALLAWAYVSAGVRGIHGPLGVQLHELPTSDVTAMIEMLTETKPRGVRSWSLASSPLNVGANATGTRRGPLFAGNLTLISVLVGTPWALPLRNSITLIEEIGERPYELDRYLTQLILAGELQKPSAVIVGDLTRCVDPKPPTGVPDPDEAALATILERCFAAGTPAAFGAPIGHGDRNEPVPFGGEAVLDLDRNTFEITESAVQ